MSRRRTLAASVAAALLTTALAAQAQPVSTPTTVAPASPGPVAASVKPGSGTSSAVATPEHTAGVDSKDPTAAPVLAPLIADSDRLTAANDPNRYSKPRFLTNDPHSGLDVWFMATKDNDVRIVYTNPAGTAIIGGKLFAVNPTNPGGDLVYLLGQHTIAAIAVLASEGKLPPPSAAAGPDQTAATPVTPSTSRPSTASPQAVQSRPPLKGSAMLAAFDAATWIESGTNPTAPLIYAVVDPECPYCANFTAAILPELDAGRVRVRWLVTAPLAAGNGGKSFVSATNILSAPAADRSAAWIDHAERRPAKPSDAAAQSTARAEVAANDQMRMTMLDANGLSGVPFLFYRTKDGQIGYRLGINASDVPALVTSLGPLHTGR
ncbi:hypothetical protein [Azospirillum canadense]|uniref:hypothetical protein n=1 Tax=Azospirillum canadense TaxID=403962 RepID=UPI0022261D7B|nr:hypothetical protein [Azospirillum canadense]MCW2240757.1 protein-disulfide isomerase [Azospirillum canadense]